MTRSLARSPGNVLGQDLPPVTQAPPPAARAPRLAGFSARSGFPELQFPLFKSFPASRRRTLGCRPSQIRFGNRQEGGKMV